MSILYIVTILYFIIYIYEKINSSVSLVNFVYYVSICLFWNSKNTETCDRTDCD